MLFQAAQPAYAIAYATWSDTDKHADITLDATKLIVTDIVSSTFRSGRATIGKTSGKFFFELKSQNSQVYFGLANEAVGLLPTALGNSLNSGGYRGVVNTYIAASSFTLNGTPIAPGWTNNTDYMIIVDADNGKGYLAKANAMINGGDVVAGTGYIWSWTPGLIIYPAYSISNGGSAAITGNFGASAFSNSTIETALLAAGYTRGVSV